MLQTIEAVSPLLYPRATAVLETLIFVVDVEADCAALVVAISICAEIRSRDVPTGAVIVDRVYGGAL